MQQEKYDIFISYRRKDENGKEWGTSIARNILQGLEDRGYKGRVFFDHNKIGPEDFEKKILGAIKQAKVFLCILTKNAMDNCVNEGDWVRREICQAIESGLKIIFINPDNEFNHKLLPKGLPKELEIVKMQNSLEIRSGQKFEVDMDDVVKRYISEIVPCHNMPSFKSQPSVPMGILRVNTDLDCRVFNYGKDVGVAKAGVYTTFELPLGDNDLKYVGLESDDDCYGEMVTILENHQKLVRVKLLDKYNTRKEKEKKERTVFISYSKKDAERIKPLRDALTAAGIKYWIDDRIEGSENFLAEIPDAIQKCFIVLFIASQNSANSEWTQKELVYARKLNKEIFPYKLDNFQFDNCPELDFFFTNIQWKENVEDVVAGLAKKLWSSKI